MPTPSNDPPVNPYEAPQSRDLPTASLVEATTVSDSLVSPPREVQRWMNAAMGLYFVSFIVPYAPWFWQSEQDWHWGIGTVFCIFGVFFFWHPYMISWWANVMFWIAYRDMNRVTLGNALGFTIAGMCLAPISGIIGLGPLTSHDYQRDEPLLVIPACLSAPFLCWTGSMLLMLIAAIKLRRHGSMAKVSDTIHE